jgi:hypothetical protein
MLSRLATCVIVLLLSGCNTYLLETTPGSPNSSIPPSNTTFTDIIDPGQIYTSIYAETKLTNQDLINACSNYFVLTLLMAKQTNITLTAIQPLTNVSLPLLSVSQTGNNCTTQYSAIYVLPRQLLSATTNTALGGNYLYNVTSNEQVTKYLTDAVALAGLFVPAGSAAFVATAAAVSQTALANDVKSGVNSAFSSSTNTTGPLVLLVPEDLKKARIQSGFDITVHKIQNFARSRYRCTHGYSDFYCRSSDDRAWPRYGRLAVVRERSRSDS